MEHWRTTTIVPERRAQRAEEGKSGSGYDGKQKSKHSKARECGTRSEGHERIEYLVRPVVERGRVGRGYGTEHIGLDAEPREARGSAPQVKWGAARMLQLLLWARAPGPQHALIPEVHVDRVRLKTHTAVT